MNINRFNKITNAILEAKTFKNSISKAMSDRVDEVIYNITFRSPSFAMKKWIEDNNITDTSSYVLYVEKVFREHNASVLLKLKYIQWILKQLVHGYRGATTLNLHKISKNLIKFDSLYNRKLLDSDDENIDRLNIDDLEYVVNSTYDPRDEDILYKKKEASITFENSQLKIVQIDTFRACEFFSGGSRGRSRPWCIASNDKDWNDYIKGGSVFHILLVKGTGEKYAIDAYSGEVTDNNNRALSFDAIVRKFPIISKYISPVLLTTAEKIETRIRELFSEIDEDDKGKIEIDASVDEHTAEVKYSILMMIYVSTLSLVGYKNIFENEMKQIAHANNCIVKEVRFSKSVPVRDYHMDILFIPKRQT